MVCAVQPNAAAIAVVDVPFSNATTPHAAMLHDATAFAVEDVEEQAEIPAVRNEQAKPDPCVRYFVDSLESAGQVGHDDRISAISSSLSLEDDVLRGRPGELQIQRVASPHKSQSAKLLKNKRFTPVSP
jgi:hypothetical protein